MMGDDEALVYACLLSGDGAGRQLDWDGVGAWQQGQGGLWVHLDRTVQATRDWLARGDVPNSEVSSSELGLVVTRGALEGAGIQLPERFDLKGIFSLIFQVLGLTYAAIRQRAVRIVGEPIVARLEQVAEIFLVLKREGLAGLYRWVVELEQQARVVAAKAKT